MAYKCKLFKIYELVDPVTYKARGQLSWELMDERLLRLIDKLRDTFGPATINTWKWGGKFRWSGLRTPACNIGARRSQHRYGRAVDMKFKNIKPAAIRKAIRLDSEYWKKQGVCCVENGTKTWLHVDVRNTKKIKWVNP